VTDDIQAIKDLVYSYAELLDTGDIEGLGLLFAEATLRTDGASEDLQGADWSGD
jgi:hypothetical protein